MSYYKDCQKAFQFLDKLLTRLKEDKEDTTITFIDYNITKDYPISSKLIKERIKNYCELNNIKIANDTIKFSKRPE